MFEQRKSLAMLGVPRYLCRSSGRVERLFLQVEKRSNRQATYRHPRRMEFSGSPRVCSAVEQERTSPVRISPLSTENLPDSREFTTVSSRATVIAARVRRLTAGVRDSDLARDRSVNETRVHMMVSRAMWKSPPGVGKCVSPSGMKSPKVCQGRLIVENLNRRRRRWTRSAE